MSIRDEIQSQIRGQSRTLETRDEIIAYYQREYPGEIKRGSRMVDRWKVELVDTLQPHTRGKNGEPLSRESVLRRFNKRGGRKELSERRVPPGQVEEYKALGKELPPEPPESGYSVTFQGEVKISGRCKYVQFADLLISGEEAEELAESADIYLIMREYFQGLDMMEGLCGDPQIVIEAAKAKMPQMAFKHGPQGPSIYQSILKKK